MSRFLRNLVGSAALVSGLGIVACLSTQGTQYICNKNGTCELVDDGVGDAGEAGVSSSSSGDVSSSSSGNPDMDAGVDGGSGKEVCTVDDPVKEEYKMTQETKVRFICTKNPGVLATYQYTNDKSGSVSCSGDMYVVGDTGTNVSTGFLCPAAGGTATADVAAVNNLELVGQNPKFTLQPATAPKQGGFITASGANVVTTCLSKGSAATCIVIE